MVIRKDFLGSKTLRARAIPVGALIPLSFLMIAGVLCAAFFPDRFSGPRPSLGSDALPFILLASPTARDLPFVGNAFTRDENLSQKD